jgi:hypothetical protein
MSLGPLARKVLGNKPLAETFSHAFEGEHEAFLTEVVAEYTENIKNSMPLYVSHKVFQGVHNLPMLTFSLTHTIVDATDLESKYQAIFDMNCFNGHMRNVFSITSFYDMIILSGQEDPVHAIIIQVHSAKETSQFVYTTDDIHGEFKLLEDLSKIESMADPAYSGLASNLIYLGYVATYSEGIRQCFVHWSDCNFAIEFFNECSEDTIVMNTGKILSLTNTFAAASD